MGHSIHEPAAAAPRQTLADVRGRAVKAELRTQVGASRLRELAAETVKRVSSQKAAAIDLDLSESRLSHKFKDGTITLRELETLGVKYAAEFGRSLIEEYGEAVKSPKEQARERIPELIRELLAATA